MASIIFALLAGILPALFWLWFWLHEDSAKPEPKPLIGEIFVVGCLAVIPAYFLEKWLSANALLSGPEKLFWLLFVWAVIEEVLKYLAVYASALRTRFYDEPVDAMIYLITAALGFAAVENTLFILSALNGAHGAGLEYILTGNLRFLGATLVHVVGSALVGSAIGLSFYASWVKKRLALITGLTAAVLLHAGFNYLIIKSDDGQILKIFALLWIAGVAIIFLFERVKRSINHQYFSRI